VRSIISLVRQAQKGNQNAYIQLFGQFESDIYRIAFLYLNHQEDALDVVQETAYRSYRALPGLKEPKYFKTWLISIAIRCSIDLLRHRRKVVPLKREYEEILTDNGEVPDIPLSLSIQDMIDRLNEEVKSVIILRFYYDNTIKDTADLLEIPLGTTKTILYRALGKLRKQAREDGWIEP